MTLIVPQSVLVEYCKYKTPLTILCCIPEIPDDIIQLIFTRLMLLDPGDDKNFDEIPENYSQLTKLIIEQLLEHPNYETRKLPLLPPWFFLEEFILRKYSYQNGIPSIFCVCSLAILGNYWDHSFNKNSAEILRCILHEMLNSSESSRAVDLFEELIPEINWPKRNQNGDYSEELHKIPIFIADYMKEKLTIEWINKFLAKQKPWNEVKEEWIKFILT